MNNKDISTVVHAIKSGEMTCLEVVTYYLNRIKVFDALKAVIELNPDVLEIAQKLDSNPIKEGCLFGVPILIKDNLNTMDKMATSAGSLALSNNFSNVDSEVVRLLREEGAIILGKTNMSEFAGHTTDGMMPDGYSSRGGQTLNFWDAVLYPGGSSTGSAVAVAADLCLAAIGTETFGSIISPSQASGIIGFKPTLGLIDKAGLLPLSLTLDTIGPMVRTIADAQVLLSVLTGRNKQPNEVKFKRVCVGVLDNENMEYKSELKRLIESLTKINVHIKELPRPEIQIGKSCYHLISHEFKFGINHYLQSMNNPDIPQSLREIIELNQSNEADFIPYGQDNLIDYELNTSGQMNEPIYQQARLVREKAISDFNNYFNEQEIDLILDVPAHHQLAAWTGFPSLTLPLGKREDGSRFGLILIGKKFNEALLLNFASELEQILY